MIHRKPHKDSVTEARKLSHAKENPKLKIKYKQSYPNGVDLTPGTTVHDNLVTEIINVLKSSKNKMGKYHQQWKDVEDKMKPYVEPTLAESVRQQTGTTPIYIPLSYATLQTWLTFMVNSFLIRNPIFRYTSLSGKIEDELGALLLERLIHYQCINNNFVLPLHTFFRDACQYGIGVIAPSWEMRYIDKTDAHNGFMGNTGSSKIVTYEGNRLINIHPRNFFPDPNVDINRINDGNFVGWAEVASINKLKMVENENANDPAQGLFNVDYIDAWCNPNSTGLLDEEALLTDIADMTTSVRNIAGITKQNDIDITNAYMYIIPKEWGLGDVDKPQMWMFMIAGQRVIINARPVSLYYDGFPIVAAAPETDGYSIVSNSKLSMMDGIQTTINWLFHSHMANVKKAINDTFVYNPFLINEQDLYKPGPAKMVRLNQVAWGMPNVMDQAIKQLQTIDVTKQHMGDIGSLMPLEDLVTGVNQQTMGLMATTGERRTKAEAMSAFTSATNRIEKDAFLMQSQAIKPLGKMLALHTQQFMSQSNKLRLTSEALYKLSMEYGLPVGDEMVTINTNREDINIAFDVAVNDNFMNKQTDLDAWSSFLQVVMSNPQVAPNIDFSRLTLHLLREAGAPNAYDFFKQAQPIVMPDEELMKQKQAGNVVPVEGIRNGKGSF